MVVPSLLTFWTIKFETFGFMNPLVLSAEAHECINCLHVLTVILRNRKYPIINFTIDIDEFSKSKLR
jgi:hypothetical protein